MPILKPVIVKDPFAPLAWNASVALLALNKLAAGAAIKDDEKSSLEKLSELVARIVTACRRAPEDLLAEEKDVVTSSLLASFCAIADDPIGSNTNPATELDQAARALEEVVGHLRTGANVPSEVIGNAQEACLVLLESANVQRSGNDRPAYVQF